MAGGSSSGGVPPGFRFHPTDEELLHFYLKKKISFQKFDMEVIKEVDLNKIEPWELQERCKIGSTPQNEWYFFSHKDRKYPTGSRTNRATSAGFWKATGRDKCIRNSLKKMGMRKTLVFYRGRAPHGQKTDWIMHEYRLEDSDHDDPQPATHEDGWVICRVFKKKNVLKINGTSSSTSHELGHHHRHNNNNNNNGGMMRMMMMNADDDQVNMSSGSTSAITYSHQYLQVQAHDLNSYSHHHHHIPLMPPHLHHQIEAGGQSLNTIKAPAAHEASLMMLSSPNDHLSTADVYNNSDDQNMHMQVKQFMSSRDHDQCDAGSSMDHAHHQWDRLTNPTTINQLSLQDFWAYGK